MAKSKKTTEDTQDQPLQVWNFPHGIDGKSQVSISLEGTTPEDAIERYQNGEQNQAGDQDAAATDTDTADENTNEHAGDEPAEEDKE